MYMYTSIRCIYMYVCALAVAYVCFLIVNTYVLTCIYRYMCIYIYVSIVDLK